MFPSSTSPHQERTSLKRGAQKMLKLAKKGTIWPWSPNPFQTNGEHELPYLTYLGVLLFTTSLSGRFKVDLALDISPGKPLPPAGGAPSRRGGWNGCDCGVSSSGVASLGVLGGRDPPERALCWVVEKGRPKGKPKIEGGLFLTKDRPMGSNF